MNQISRQSPYGGAGAPRLYFYSQRTRASNLMLLKPIQSKIQTSKILYYASHCANEYVRRQKSSQNIMGSY